MSALRQKMIEDLQLRGFAERTQEAYLRAVRQRARYYQKPPDPINEEELRQYCLFLKNEKPAARATGTIARCGIKFFFERSLGREWKTFEFLRPPPEKRLPVVLSRVEVRSILSRVHRRPDRVGLTTIYACGLRLWEGVRLQVQPLDGARQWLHISQGKGNKDRDGPLPSACLTMLRPPGLTHRNPVWLFPSPVGDSHPPRRASGLPRAFCAARQEAGIHKKATVHTLRHS